METNFNQSPYNDDYLNTIDPNTGVSIHTKNFHRILFKPGVAVQARELTQSQSILQDQIKKFGDHIFKNHTQVYGAELTYNFSVRFLKLQEFDINNQGIVLTNFVGTTITNESGKTEAKVLHYIDGTEKILILAYMSSGDFYAGETIFAKGLEYTAKVLEGDQTQIAGPSSICSINNGVFYIDGYFVNVYKQTITIDEFSSSPTARIGLSVLESIVSHDEDTSLLDPALGASNFQAPGADRFKVSLSLVKKPLTIDNDTTFIELVRIFEGKILKAAMYTEYSEIDKYFARRTSETNGDFIVNKFNITVQDNPIDANTFLVKLSPGKAYVNGFIVENQSDLTFTNSKSRTYNNVQNTPFFVNYGNILYLNNINKGFVDINSFQKVDFHCSNTISTASLAEYNTTLAGSARVKSIKFISAEDLNNPATYIYETYLIDVETKEISGETSVCVVGDIPNNVPATITLPTEFSTTDGIYNGIKLKITSGPDSGDILTISSYEGVTRIATLASPTNNNDFINDPLGGGTTSFTFSLLFDVKDFEYLRDSGNPTSAAIVEANISTMSKTPANSAGNVYFRNLNNDKGLVYKIGEDYIVQNSLANVEYYSWMKFTSVSEGSSYFLPENSFNFTINGGTVTGIDAAENFIVFDSVSGTLVPFDISGANNVIITTYVGSPSSFVFNSTTPSLTGPFTVYVRVKVSEINYSNLTRRTKQLVLGNISSLSSFSVGVTGNTYLDTNLGQVKIKKADQTSNRMSLYVSDVKRIVKIIDTKNIIDSSVLTNPECDITRYFELNTGQTDNYYDFASIKKLPNSPNIIEDLIVIFDYYSHSGNGYLDNKSYIDGGETYETIPFYVNTAGQRLELRDCVDFRPTRVNGITGFSLVGTSDRPIKIPLDSTSFECDYSYYIGRKDILVIGKDNDFKLIQGIPALNAIEPSQPDGSMLLGKIHLDPYVLRVTSDSRGALYSNIKIKTMIHKRWTMEDITLLENRVARVEYYTTLNTLELAAIKMQIPDETGLNRFKNGILTEDFSSLLVSDIEKGDFYASIKRAKTKLYAVHDIKNYDLTIKDAIGTLGRFTPTELTAKDYAVNYDGNDAYLTLPYSVVTAASQPLASDIINVNPFNVIVVEGLLELTPKFDAWVSVTKLPDVHYDLSGLQSNTINALTTGDYETLMGARLETANGVISIKGSIENFDGWVTDVSLNPWIREQQIQFVARELLRNTLVYAYFDDVEVTSRIRESNTITIDTDDNFAFEDGDVIAPNSNSGLPVGKILTAYSTKYTAENGTTRYSVECELISDLGIDSYTLPSSNTIYSVYLSTNGNITSSKGSGEITAIQRNSGRIQGIIPGTSNKTVAINRFFVGEANTIPIASSFTVIDESSLDIYSNIVESAEEDNANNIIKITFTEAVKGLDGYPEYPNPLSGNDKRLVYCRKTGRQLKTNNKGSVCGILYLPSDAFHTGDRVFRIDNRISGNKGTETTYCETVFFASNLAYDKRNIVIDIPPPTIVPPPPPPPSSSSSSSSSSPPPPSSSSSSIEPSCSYSEVPGYYGQKGLQAVKPGAFVSGWRLKAKRVNIYLQPISIFSWLTTMHFNKNVGTNYPYLEEFDTNTIVYDTFFQPGNTIGNIITDRSEELEWYFSQFFEVVKTYYTYDKNCANPQVRLYHHDPIAQTVILFKEEFPYGAFIKSVTVFFRNKPDDFGPNIRCLLTETNNGIPTKVAIPHATAILTPDKVNISDVPCIYDIETGTTFEFPIPIFLKPDTLYSFILKTDSDEYEVYTARLGDHPIPSTTKNFVGDGIIVNGKISKTPYVGELFKSQNMLTWTSEPNDDIMFTLNRCDFDIRQKPKIEFVVPKYMPQRKLGDFEIEFLNENTGNLAIGTAGTTNDPFVIDAFNVTTTDITFTEAPINYSYRATTKTNYTKDQDETYFVPGKFGSPSFDEIILDDGKGERVFLPNTLPSLYDAYSFSLYAGMSSSHSTISPMISELGLSVFGIKYNINDLGISNSNITIIDGGTGYSNTLTTMNLIKTSAIVTGNSILGTSAVVRPVVNSTGSIINVESLIEGSGYASSPIIEISDPNRSGNSNASIIVHGETGSYGGNGLLRYITKPVILTQDFDAGDLRVYLTAYRPKNTNIFVYYKILSREDTQILDDSDWQIMTSISGGSTFAKSRNQTFEYVFAPYDLINAGLASNKVSYISKTNGKTYTRFYQFALKIVMSSSDPTFVPYVDDMRAIALVPIEL